MKIIEGIRIFNNRSDDVNVRRKYAELLGTIAAKLNGKYLDDTLQYLVNGLKDKSWSFRWSCQQVLAKKWNEKQLDIIVQYLVDELQNINRYYC
ncbi:hypothetical protein RFI_38782 [Reticulomyxa filosa]|uniref:Uncharacterized protein n=1 Tax=Reticulomyxa filosa TaxID=46433 RepID=X6LBF3_RETFI|nr:hypothetical protein RFI_38782 [Reticulomyxa filosa]|eukprot:ETN98710.1 hypothetical protein RFI_38782 [Reticulomyxa filosa]